MCNSPHDVIPGRARVPGAQHHPHDVIPGEHCALGAQCEGRGPRTRVSRDVIQNSPGDDARSQSLLLGPLPLARAPRRSRSAGDDNFWKWLAQFLLGAAVAFALLAPPAFAADSAQDIVAKADIVRNPSQPFRNLTTLIDYRSGTPHDKSVLAVYSKIDPATHQFKNLVRYVDPPRDAGKMVLLGDVLWFYDPASKDSVRISPQQRLTGNAAIGDVLTVNLAVDYTATIDGEETVQDAEHAQRQCWHLDLKAATPSATYNRVEYWVEKGTFDPIKMKFYSDSGRLLKILYYRAYAQRLNGLRPTQAVIIDAVDSTAVTTVDFTAPEFRDIPDAWFQRDYLPHFKAD